MKYWHQQFYKAIFILFFPLFALVATWLWVQYRPVYTWIEILKIGWEAFDEEN